MIGYSFSVGLLGAIYGGKPISVLIETHYWKNVALTLAIVSVVIGLSAWLFLRPMPAQSDEPLSESSFKLSYFKTLFRSPMMWLLALANLLMVGSPEGFSDVWGVSYLMTAYSINKGDAAQLISFVFIGMLFGGPLLALCSKKLGNYLVIALCGLGMAVAFAVLLSCKQYEWWLFASLFFAVGIMCCYQVIVFAAGAELVAPQYLGVTIAFLNCINMFGGSFFHTTIGWLMDIFWTGALNSQGIKAYNLATYQWSLMLIPFCALLGAVIIGGLGLRARHTRVEI